MSPWSLFLTLLGWLFVLILGFTLVVTVLALIGALIKELKSPKNKIILPLSRGELLKQAESASHEAYKEDLVLGELKAQVFCESADWAYLVLTRSLNSGHTHSQSPCRWEP